MILNEEFRVENALLRLRKRNTTLLIRTEKSKQEKIISEIRKTEIQTKQFIIFHRVISNHTCEDVVDCSECRRIEENHQEIVNQNFAWVHIPYIIPVCNNYGNILFGIDARHHLGPLEGRLRWV